MKNNFDTFRADCSSPPIFSVAQKHPRWRQSPAVNTFCLLSVTEQKKITPEKQFYSQKTTEAENFSEEGTYTTVTENSKNCFRLLASLDRSIFFIEYFGQEYNSSLSLLNI